MKTIAKIVRVTFLAAVILCTMTMCALLADDDDDGEKDTNGPTHFEGVLKVSNEQVWLQNKEAKRQSDAWYFKFEGGNGINVFTGFSYDDQGKVVQLKKLVGSGKIEKGRLNFVVAELAQEDLVRADILATFFKEYKDVTIEPSDVKGTNILPVTSANERLNREGLFLLNSSVGVESVMFLYVDKDCRITGNPDVITWDQGERSYISKTDSAIDIPLQKGWNTLYRTEVFDRESGYDNVSMGISNPNNFKWVLYQQ